MTCQILGNPKIKPWIPGGSGKSYLAKLDILRSRYHGVQVAVIDPKTNTPAWPPPPTGPASASALRGRLNPFDLPSLRDPGRARAEGLMRRALFLHTFLGVLLGETLMAAERAAPDQAIMTCYHRAGITADPRTWARPAPLLADLAAALRDGGGAGAGLAARLVPFTEGTHSQLFAGPAATRAGGHLVTWSLRDLPDELKTAGILLTLDAVWRQVSDQAGRQRRLVVDEAWLLMRQHDGAQFLFRMARAARKH